MLNQRNTTELFTCLCAGVMLHYRKRRCLQDFRLAYAISGSCPATSAICRGSRSILYGTSKTEDANPSFYGLVFLQLTTDGPCYPGNITYMNSNIQMANHTMSQSTTKNSSITAIVWCSRHQAKSFTTFMSSNVVIPSHIDSLNHHTPCAARCKLTRHG